MGTGRQTIITQMAMKRASRDGKAVQRAGNVALFTQNIVTVRKVGRNYTIVFTEYTKLSLLA